VYGRQVCRGAKSLREVSTGFGFFARVVKLVGEAIVPLEEQEEEAALLVEDE